MFNEITGVHFLGSLAFIFFAGEISFKHLIWLSKNFEWIIEFEDNVSCILNEVASCCSCSNRHCCDKLYTEELELDRKLCVKLTEGTLLFIVDVCLGFGCNVIDIELVEVGFENELTVGSITWEFSIGSNVIEKGLLSEMFFGFCWRFDSIHRKSSIYVGNISCRTLIRIIWKIINVDSIWF